MLHLVFLIVSVMIFLCFEEIFALGSLCVLTLKALCGLQKLSPDIFQQINFRPAKLLPPPLPSSSSSSSCEGEGGESSDGVMVEMLCLALQANVSAYEETLGRVSP